MDAKVLVDTCKQPYLKTDHADDDEEDEDNEDENYEKDEEN